MESPRWQPLACCLFSLNPESAGPEAFRPGPRAHLGLAAADGPRTDGARLLVPAQDLRDAAVGHAQLAGDDAGPDAVVGHLHYLVADVVRQGSPVDEDPTKLVDPALAKWGGH